MSEEGEKQALAVAAAPESAPRANRGWFQPGDKRINKEGRPRGSKAAVAEGTHPADCAQWADRLMRLVVSEPVLACCLAGVKSPCVVNLPADFRVVGCRFDADRQRAVLTLWSATFPRVAKGARIPKMEPRFRNLMWVKRRGVIGIFPAR
jgi:hypothetical protein